MSKLSIKAPRKVIRQLGKIGASLLLPKAKRILKKVMTDIHRLKKTGESSSFHSSDLKNPFLTAAQCCFNESGGLYDRMVSEMVSDVELESEHQIVRLLKKASKK